MTMVAPITTTRRPENNSGENSSEEISKNESQKVSPYGEWQQVNPEGQQVKPEKDEKSSRKKKSSAPRETSSSSQKPVSFGKWEEITEEDSFEKVDLELRARRATARL
ncbi:hypothetical protein E2320_022568 [Naja naja]|nr:hypothetical protein E2320_022568 [Naja naja]